MPPAQRRNKTVGTAYAWWATLGLFGGHRFYLGEVGPGIGYCFSVGGFFVLWFRDLFRMTDLVRAANADRNLKNIADATSATAHNTER